MSSRVASDFARAAFSSIRIEALIIMLSVCPADTDVGHVIEHTTTFLSGECSALCDLAQ